MTRIFNKQTYNNPMINDIILGLFVNAQQHEERLFPKEFEIILDDRTNARRLFSLINSYISLNDVKERAELDDVITFKKDDIYLHEGSRCGIYFSVRREYSYIEQLLRNFFKTFIPKKKKIEPIQVVLGCPFMSSGLMGCATTPINNTRLSNRYYDGDILNLEEEIHIFPDFVKVGFELYEIWSTDYNTKIVKIGRSTYKVDQDLIGRKFLEKI